MKAPIPRKWDVSNSFVECPTDKYPIFIDVRDPRQTVCYPLKAGLLCDKVTQTEAQGSMSITNPVSKPEELSPEQIGLVRDHLKEMLASRAFAGSRRAQDFLQLIVEHALAARFDCLRERMIGAEMFGRPIDYDTANDAVVRVKATEVRKRLAEYYRELLEPPAVRIELPTGSYVPKFHWECLEASAQSHTEADFPNSAEQRTRVTASATEEEQVPVPGKKLHRVPPVLAGVLLGLALVATIGYASFKQWFEASNGGSQIHSIAILPLRNLSGDPGQEYLADGMTEELIADLGQVSALRVISRTSVMTYKGTKKKLPEIARELRVDAVIEGSVVREGNRVRTTAQLIDAKTDHHLWARTYDRDLTSVLALQGEVAQAIADEIRIEVTPQEQTRMARTRPVNAEAQELYLQGKYRLNLGDPRGAIGYLEKAVDNEPGYAPAHAALANAYGWMGEAGWMPYSEAFPKQKAEAAKAIELDDALPEGHVEFANAVMSLSWDWTTQGDELKRALDLNPNAAAIHWAYSNHLAKTGRSPEALTEMKHALQLDPVSSRSFMNSGFTHYFARQYDRAFAQIKRAYELRRDAPEIIFPLGVIYVEKGMYKQAIEEFQKLGDQPHALGHMGNAYAREGRVTEARAAISKLKEHVQKNGVGRYEIALVYAGLGEKSEALTWLEKSYESRDKGLTYLKIDPCLDPLRSDPRFQDLLRRVGLPL
jgi:TolB-like protein/Flp pilus assembly protein TadD